MRPVAVPAIEPAGTVAETINDLWWLMLALGTAVFVVFAALLARGLLRRGHGEAAPDNRLLTRRWVLGGGVLMPVAVLVTVFGATVKSMRATSGGASPGALTVEIIGHQWWYEVRYPDDGVSADVLHLPLGRRIELRLRSEDVIHSFWVPELAGKMDMLPDKTNTLVLQADKPGSYVARCAEFCGRHHAEMHLPVIAEPAERFAAWLTEQR